MRIGAFQLHEASQAFRSFASLAEFLGILARPWNPELDPFQPTEENQKPYSLTPPKTHMDIYPQNDAMFEAGDTLKKTAIIPWYLLDRFRGEYLLFVSGRVPLSWWCLRFLNFFPIESSKTLTISKARLYGVS